MNERIKSLQEAHKLNALIEPWLPYVDRKLESWLSTSFERQEARSFILMHVWKAACDSDPEKIQDRDAYFNETIYHGYVDYLRVKESALKKDQRRLFAEYNFSVLSVADRSLPNDFVFYDFWEVAADLISWSKEEKRYLSLLRQGLSYTDIESEMGITGNNGNWVRHKIVKKCKRFLAAQKAEPMAPLR